ncbi:hypothetical protein ZIOFF_037836 [Zingiber officinale]|uniref:Peroxisome biogenesis protein 22 n=1 Tax=Zingiber officinale TaxID=94328 RepID=A0A8J5LA77_ZINOF|nr:hypothetical protein ZIOFF_037836 [Zingiber officinale]
MVAPQSMMGSVSQSSDADKGDELRDLMQRFMASLAEFSQRLPFDVDFQKLRSITTLATLAVTLIFAWKLWRTIPDQQLRQRRRPSTSSSFSTNNLHPDTSLRSSEIRSYSGDSRAQRSVNEFIQPLELSLEQLVRHRLNDGRKVTCQLLGVVLDETTPEELQTRATVRSSVLEVLLQISKFCDVYLMERILDDESGDFLLLLVTLSFNAVNVKKIWFMKNFVTQERVLSALEDSGVFTSGGLVRDKVLFCSTENGRISFVRQLEPDWHIDASTEIVHQLTDTQFSVVTYKSMEHRKARCHDAIHVRMDSIKMANVLLSHASSPSRLLAGERPWPPTRGQAPPATACSWASSTGRLLTDNLPWPPPAHGRAPPATVCCRASAPDVRLLVVARLLTGECEAASQLAINQPTLLLAGKSKAARLLVGELPASVRTPAYSLARGRARGHPPIREAAHLLKSLVSTRREAIGDSDVEGGVEEGDVGWIS